MGLPRPSGCTPRCSPPTLRLGKKAPPKNTKNNRTHFFILFCRKGACPPVTHTRPHKTSPNPPARWRGTCWGGRPSLEEGCQGGWSPHLTPEVRTTLAGPDDPGDSATPEHPPEESPPFPGLPKGRLGSYIPIISCPYMFCMFSPFILSTSRDRHPLGMPDPAGFAPFGFPFGETVPGDSLGVGL